MEKIRILYNMVCLVCLGFNVGMCAESDLLIKTYVSSSLPSNNDLVYYTKLQVPSISESDWDSLVMQSNIPVMVLFKTKLCPPCRLIQLEMDVLDLQFKYRFQFYTIDVDEAKEVQEFYEVETVPTTIVFIDGKEVDIIFGYQPGKYRNLVNKYLGFPLPLSV